MGKARWYNLEKVRVQEPALHVPPGFAEKTVHTMQGSDRKVKVVKRADPPIVQCVHVLHALQLASVSSVGHLTLSSSVGSITTGFSIMYVVVGTLHESYEE